MRGRGVLLADPISDLFARIRNGQNAKRAAIHHPYSRFARDVVNALIRQGYVSSISIIPPKSPREPQFNQMHITLKYDNYGQPAIKKIRRVSKPSRRVYRSIAELPLASNGLGSWILSTPKGVLHCAEARDMNVGGEVLGEVF
ncbi:ribosome protein S8 [Gracilaria domingensis]|nr:ribosome protein S8 [Gracilaria domingensis]